ncbi:MAG: peptidylprolyl isomerase [Coriobacteriaceae bacterium]|nr:peptidylprolyl isomerase [Coriobacteriaceae bacterium]
MKLGSTVKLVYTGTLKDGTVFGYAKPDGPMEFQTGMDLTIEGFEREILKMEEGEKKTFEVGMYDAYGEYLDDFVEVVPVENVPLKNVEIGNRIWLTGDDGEKFPVKVLDINSKEITFDMNHPLAGEDLTFEVEILSVEEPPEGWEPPKKHDGMEYVNQLM